MVELTAHQPWEEQGLFCAWIKLAYHGRLPGSRTDRRGVTILHQFFETLLCLQKSSRIFCIKIVPAIAVVVHDDLSCHPYAPCFLLDESEIANAAPQRKFQSGTS